MAGDFFFSNGAGGDTGSSATLWAGERIGFFLGVVDDIDVEGAG